jgi:hypothetical protein
VGLERGPLSLVNNLRSYLEETVEAPGLENRSYADGIWISYHVTCNLSEVTAVIFKKHGYGANFLVYVRQI